MNYDMYQEIGERVSKGFALDMQGCHGVSHWARVLQWTDWLVDHYKKECGLGGFMHNSDFFELFSLLHDSQRDDEWSDPYHGHRAADFAADLHSEGLIRLSNEAVKDAVLFDELYFAIKGHTEGVLPESEAYQHAGLITKEYLNTAICWDADALDLGRVRMSPDPVQMRTWIGKEIARGKEDAEIDDHGPPARWGIESLSKS